LSLAGIRLNDIAGDSRAGSFNHFANFCWQELKNKEAGPAAGRPEACTHLFFLALYAEISS
jgi:hypothetical protein